MEVFFNGFDTGLKSLLLNDMQSFETFIFFKELELDRRETSRLGMCACMFGETGNFNNFLSFLEVGSLYTRLPPPFLELIYTQICTFMLVQCMCVCMCPVAIGATSKY